MQAKEIHVHISPEQLRLDSFRLATSVISFDFRPTNVLALMRGGGAIAMYVHEMLSRVYKCRLGFDAITTKRTKRVDGNGIMTDDEGNTLYDIEVPNAALASITAPWTSETRLLIVDDIFDTGSTMDEVIEVLVRLGVKPYQIRIATIDYKPDKNLTSRMPDYYVNERAANIWVSYPHEISDVADSDIASVFGETICELVTTCTDLTTIRNEETELVAKCRHLCGYDSGTA